MQGPKPKFRSRYADPNHPANSGSLIALVTGGKINPPPLRLGGGMRGGFALGGGRGFGRGGFGGGFRGRENNNGYNPNQQQLSEEEYHQMQEQKQYQSSRRGGFGGNMRGRGGFGGGPMVAPMLIKKLMKSVCYVPSVLKM